MKQKQFYFIYVFLLSMTFLGACSKDSPNELIPNTIVKIEIDELPGKEILTEGMQQAADLKVALAIDLHTGKNWYEAK